MAFTFDAKVEQALLDALYFEQYLRYFYLAPETDALVFLEVPYQAVKAVEKENPELVPLLRALQGTEITHEESRAAVLKQAAVLAGLETSSSYFIEQVSHISVSSEFQDKLLHFNDWIMEQDETEEQLDFISYKDWISNYQRP